MNEQQLRIDDGRPLSTEDDMRETADMLGITYEEYIQALDKHLITSSDILQFVAELRKTKHLD